MRRPEPEPLTPRMTCHDLEQFLLPYVDGEFDAQERAELHAHLAACASCTARVRAEQQLRDMIQGAARELEATFRAPEGLRERVRLGIAKESQRALRRRLLPLSAAAAVVALVGTAAYVAYRPHLRQRFIEDAAVRHAKAFPLEVRGPSADEIKAWFGGKLSHRIEIPSFPNAVPVGGRLLNVQEKQAAYIRYDAHPPHRALPGRIGLFVYDDSQGDADFGPRSSAQVASSHGYNVVSWRDGDVVYQLVADLDEADIRQMLAGELPPAPHLSQEPEPTTPALDIQPASLQR